MSVLDPSTQQLVAETAKLVRVTTASAHYTFFLAWFTAAAAAAGVVTAIAACLSARASQRALKAMGEQLTVLDKQTTALQEEVSALNRQTAALHEQRRAQIRPMVIYTNEGRPALVNAGNGLALNVRARWQRPDTQEPTPYLHAHAIGVGQTHWLDGLAEPFRSPEAVQVVYQDAEGTWYYNRFTRGAKYKLPEEWMHGPWTEGIWEVGPNDAAREGLVYDETGKVQRL